MFSFNLPKWALLDVVLPTGGVQRVVHVGNGVFLSQMPPVMLHAMAPVEQAPKEPFDDEAVNWDSTTVPGDATVQMFLLPFDAKGAMHAAQDAADRGDIGAISFLQRCKNADAAIDAPETVQ